MVIISQYQRFLFQNSVSYYQSQIASTYYVDLEIPISNKSISRCQSCIVNTNTSILKYQHQIVNTKDVNTKYTNLKTVNANILISNYECQICQSQYLNFNLPISNCQRQICQS